MHLLRSLAFAAILLSASAGLRAGGSSLQVSIERFEANGVDYTLVVTPSTDGPADPYMSQCRRFEVHGTYGRLQDQLLWESSLVSRDDHMAALKYLKQAFERKQPIELGWVGTGFVPVEARYPCRVKSRALQLFSDEHGTHVMSYHDQP